MGDVIFLKCSLTSYMYWHVSPKKKKKSKYCVNNSCDHENLFLSDANTSFKMYFGVIGLHFS